MEIIDPRLRSSGDLSLLATTQPPSSSFSTNPIRLPPPHQQHPLLSSNPPPSRHDGRSGHPYYALPDGPHSHRPPSHPDAHHQQGTAAAINDNEESLNDLKRPRACEPCRGLKVRCEPDANNPTGACRRCAKAGRQCIITFPSRKRQKKTDSRVAELEKRIDALTASLQATKRDGVVDLQDRSGGTSPDGGFALHGEENGESTLPTSSLPALQSGWSDTNQQPRRSEENSRTTGPRSQPQEYLGRRLSMPSYTLAGQKRRRSEDTGLVLDSTSTRDQMSCTMTVSTNGRPSDGHVFLAPTNTSSTYKPPVASAASGWPSNHVSGLEYTDVIDRKILEAGTAAQIFDHYVRDMAPHLPAVVFSPQMTAAEIRRTKPTLFLAILSVASGLSHPEVQRTLGKELMRTYADRIIVRGEKSLEIIQALQVSVLWYWPPEHYEELKFYQLVHIAAVMALDLGLGKRTKRARQKHSGLCQDHLWRKTPLLDSKSMESRRAWLGCYFLCTNTSMALRRPNMLRWNSYTSECVDALETSSDAYSSDRILCQWVKLQHIAEDIGLQFSMDDQIAQVAVLDTKLQYALKGFERQLEDWRTQLPKDIQSPSLKLSEHVANLYMHEVAMHIDPSTEAHECNPDTEPFHEVTQGELLTPAHISALTICLISIHGIFDTFLSFAVETVRNLPTFQFARVTYACVLLIRMYFAATTANAELGKVISKGDLKVEHYLDHLLDAFRAAAEAEKSRPAQKFLMVIVMLKTWFQKQSIGKLDIPKNPVAARDGQHTGGYRSLGSLSTDGHSTEAGLEIPPLRLGYIQSPSKDSSHIGGPESKYGGQGIHRLPAAHRPPLENSPLHLLSEVAMGGSTAPSYQLPAVATHCYHGQNNQNMSTALTGLHYPDPSSTGPVDVSGGGTDLHAVMNEELEQAMSMTLGEWDLSSVLQADGFFDMTVDDVPAVFESFG